MSLIFENWRKFLNEQEERRVITFDFDDTLSLSHWGEEEDDWVHDGPHESLIGRARDFIADPATTVYIVTSRFEKYESQSLEKPYQKAVQEFLDEQGISVDGIFFTNGQPKIKMLLELGSTMHHDDDAGDILDARANDIEAIVSDPYGDYKKLEASELEQREKELEEAGMPPAPGGSLNIIQPEGHKEVEEEEDLLQEQLLIEGRYDDAAKKWPVAVEQAIDNMPVLKYFSKQDPSGNNKYLMWMAKAMAQSLDEWRASGLDESSPEWRGDVEQRADDIATEVRKYHSLLTFVRNEDTPYKDINAITNLTNLRRVIYRAKHKKQRKDQEKEQERREKEEAMQGSEIVLKDDNFMMVRPTTAEASCYWGKGTRWCISAERSSNYFNSYTGEGKAFYFLFMKNKKNFAPEDWVQYKQIALVYESNEFEEAYDASDEPMDANEVQNILAINLKGNAVFEAYQEYTRNNSLETLKESEPEHYLELVRAITEDGLEGDDAADVDEWWENEVTNNWWEIEGAAQGHVEDNPAGPREDAFEQIEEEASLQNVGVYYEEYEPGRWYWSGNISFDFDDLEWDEGTVLDEYSLDEEINSILDDNYIYPDEIEVHENQVRIDIQPGVDESSGLDGFQNFVNILSEIDGKYEETRQDLIDMFVVAGVLNISASPYGQLRDKATKTEYEHFEIDASTAALKYTTRMSFKLPEINELIKEFTKDMSAGMSATGVPYPDSELSLFLKAWQNMFTDWFLGGVRSPATNFLLDALSKFFLEAQEAAHAQLNLPGVPAAAPVKQIVTPASVAFARYATAFDVSEQTVEVSLEIIADRGANDAQLQAIGEFTDYFDKHYNELYNIVESVISRILRVAADDVEVARAPENIQEKQIKNLYNELSKRTVYDDWWGEFSK